MPAIFFGLPILRKFLCKNQKPSRYGSGVSALVRKALDSDDGSLAALIKGLHRVERIEVDPETFVNVNTPEDLQDVVRRSGLPPSTR